MPTTTNTGKVPGNEVVYELIQQARRDNRRMRELVQTSADNIEFMQDMLTRMGQLDSQLTALKSSLTVPVDIEGAVRSNNFNIYNFDQVAKNIVEIKRLMARDLIVNFDEDDTARFMEMLEQNLHKSIGAAFTDTTSSEVARVMSQYNRQLSQIRNDLLDFKHKNESASVPSWAIYLIIMSTITAFGIIGIGLHGIGLSSMISFILVVLGLLGAAGFGWLKFRNGVV